jgi:hypothetical protein
VGSNFGNKDWEPVQDPNFRSLQDVVSAVEDGRPLAQPPPSAKGRVEGEPMVRYFDKLLQENSLLPVDAWDTSVANLSLFSKTGWVDRRLTLKELAVSYDLPVALHKL